MSKEIFSPATLPPPTGYSHVAKVKGGTLVYIAGQVSSDASGKLVGEGDFEAQAERVFANVKLAVEAAGATMADIVKMNTYIVASVDPADQVPSGHVANEQVQGEGGLVEPAVAQPVIGQRAMRQVRWLGARVGGLVVSAVVKMPVGAELRATRSAR